MQSRSATFSALALGIAGVLALGNAQASGFQLKENSVKATGRAAAGSAAAEGDTSVVVNNPAAMTTFVVSGAGSPTWNGVGLGITPVRTARSPCCSAR